MTSKKSERSRLVSLSLWQLPGGASLDQTCFLFIISYGSLVSITQQRDGCLSRVCTLFPSSPACKAFSFVHRLNMFSATRRVCHLIYCSTLTAGRQQRICQSDMHFFSPDAFTFLVLHCGCFSVLLRQWPGFQVDRITNGVWSPFLIRGNSISHLSTLVGEMYTRKREAFVTVRQYGHCDPDSPKVCRGNNVSVTVQQQSMPWTFLRAFKYTVPVQYPS